MDIKNAAMGVLQKCHSEIGDRQWYVIQKGYIESELMRRMYTLC
jgi:hypothetical protein